MNVPDSFIYKNLFTKRLCPTIATEIDWNMASQQHISYAYTVIQITREVMNMEAAHNCKRSIILYELTFASARLSYIFCPIQCIALHRQWLLLNCIRSGIEKEFPNVNNIAFKVIYFWSREKSMTKFILQYCEYRKSTRMANSVIGDRELIALLFT